MSDNQDALRLADELEQQFPIGTAQHYLDGEAAAELRRLHDLVEDGRILLRRKRDEIAGLKALNAELVGALTTCVCAMQDYQAGIGITEMFDKGERMGRAALEKAGVSNGS